MMGRSTLAIITSGQCGALTFNDMEKLMRTTKTLLRKFAERSANLADDNYTKANQQRALGNSHFAAFYARNAELHARRTDRILDKIAN